MRAEIGKKFLKDQLFIGAGFCEGLASWDFFENRLGDRSLGHFGSIFYFFEA